MPYFSLGGRSIKMISWVLLLKKNYIISSFSSLYYISTKEISKEKWTTPNSIKLFFYLYNRFLASGLKSTGPGEKGVSFPHLPPVHFFRLVPHHITISCFGSYLKGFGHRHFRCFCSFPFTFLDSLTPSSFFPPLKAFYFWPVGGVRALAGLATGSALTLPGHLKGMRSLANPIIPVELF